VALKIKVRLFATLREGREKEQVLEVEEGATPDEIIKSLNIKKEDVAILLINGRDGSFDRELIEGDILSIFPPVGGG
jgi:molybdopterin synthase sulfur carrier subunit